MWDVENTTPFAHAHSWERDREGADTWIVVIKGAFDILPDGSTRPALEQPPVCTVPLYNGKPGHSSLKLDTDLVRTKPATDVLVLGNAHAPGGRPTDQVDVSLKMAGFEKTLRIYGDRLWKQTAVGMRRAGPEPFTTMPITYERAFGGKAPHPEAQAPKQWDERNPVGVGYAPAPENHGARHAPNIEYADGRGEPAGFGPIAPHWLPRRQWAGTYGALWEKERKPLIPDDLDERFYMCAPLDQRPAAHLVGGEPVELTHMTPSGVLRFKLPRVVLGFETLFDGSDSVLHRQVLHSVIIEPEYPRVSLVWQSSLRCHGRVLKLDTTHVHEKMLIAGEVRT